MIQPSTIIVFIVLAAICVYHCLDWIKPPAIQIIPQLRPPWVAGQASAEVYQVTFILDRKYRLTCVKVVPVWVLETNKYAPPVWHLVSSSNSVPQRGFLYGMTIPGMQPKRADAQPQPLVPDRAYRLYLESGRVKGQVDFRTRAWTGN